ncbi:hypothetical protein [Paenibacillus medicaginis]|uniref:Transposase IS111A/IS1328/IS1533 N-terminal domain-containing protein n=1 Tax=Paenibacillus medicaginis TaxID=1470560 RepID=A0ABV5BUG6_9BACL
MIKELRENFKELAISDHAVKRAKERFQRKDKQDALHYCKSLLGDIKWIKYMGETVCDHGKRAQYVYNR